MAKKKTEDIIVQQDVKEEKAPKKTTKKVAETVAAPIKKTNAIDDKPKAKAKSENSKKTATKADTVIEVVAETEKVKKATKKVADEVAPVIVEAKSAEKKATKNVDVKAEKVETATKAEPKAEAKPATKKATKKDDVKTEKDEPATKAEAKAEAKVEAKPATKKATKKDDVKTEKDEPAAKAEAKVTEVTEEIKPLVKEPQPGDADYTGPMYSDEVLEEFRIRIMEVRQESMDELRMLRERLEDYTNYDFAEESMIYSMHMAEQGPEALEQEKTYAQVQRISEYIKKLDDALIRIKDKSYGICRVCKCLIAKERLMAVPITTLSASHKIHKRCPEDGIDRIEPLKK